MAQIIKRYLKNLLLAVFAVDPFSQELKELTKGFNSIQEALQDMQQRAERLEDEVEDYSKKINDYQNLTENLRQRIVEKDLIADTMKKDYISQIQSRDEEICKLGLELESTKDEFRKVKGDIGKEMKSTTMLAKTNNGLTDLCTAIASNDPEKLRMAAEYLDWSIPLAQIARSYLCLLDRTNGQENIG